MSTSPSTWSELRTSGAAIPGRGGHATALCSLQDPDGGSNTYAVIVGGADAFGMTSNTVAVVDVASGVAAVPLMLHSSRPQPAPRCSHSLVTIPRDEAASSNPASTARLLLFGGVTYIPQQEPLIHDDAWELVIERVAKNKANPTGLEATWAPFEATGDLPGRRHSFASCVCGQSFVVACGADGTEPTGPEQTGYTDAVHALDFATRAWRKVALDRGAIGPAREMAAAMAVSDSSVVLSGGRFPVFDPKTGEPQPAQSSSVYRVSISAAGESAAVAVVADSADLCLIAHTLVTATDGDVLAIGGQGTPSPASPLGLNEDDVAVTLPRDGDDAAPSKVARVRRTDARNANAALHFGIGHSSAFSAGTAVVVGGMLPNEVGTAQRIWVHARQ